MHCSADEIFSKMTKKMTDYTITVPAQKPPSVLVREVSDITGESLGEIYRRIASGTLLYSTTAHTASISQKCRKILAIVECCKRSGSSALCTENGRSIDEQFLRNILISSEREARHQCWLDDQGHA